MCCIGEYGKEFTWRGGYVLVIRDGIWVPTHSYTKNKKKEGRFEIVRICGGDQSKNASTFDKRCNFFFGNCFFSLALWILVTRMCECDQLEKKRCPLFFLFFQLECAPNWSIGQIQSEVPEIHKEGTLIALMYSGLSPLAPAESATSALKDWVQLMFESGFELAAIILAPPPIRVHGIF